MTTQSVQKTDSSVPSTTVNKYTFTPKVDIWETEGGYNLEVEMPGVDRTGVDVKLEEGVLSIIGRVQPDDTIGFEKIYSEYEFGNYERQFQISEVVDETNIKASIKNGILQLELPKRESAKPKRIEVKVA